MSAASIFVLIAEVGLKLIGWIFHDAEAQRRAKINFLKWVESYSARFGTVNASLAFDEAFKELEEERKKLIEEHDSKTEKLN